MGVRFFLLVILIAVTAGCPARQQPSPVCLDEVDPALFKATLDARKSLGQFITLVEKPATAEVYRAVKAEFREGEIVEHLWLRDVQFDGKHFKGTLDSTPERLTQLTQGNTYDVAPDRVFDWMVLDQGKLTGGYTIRALRDKVPAKDRLNWEREMGIHIEEPTAKPERVDQVRSDLFDSAVPAGK